MNEVNCSESGAAKRSVFDRLVMFFRCLHGHGWTYNAEQKIPPTLAQLEGGVEGFFDYAKMYCKRCGYEYQLNKRR